MRKKLERFPECAEKGGKSRRSENGERFRCVHLGSEHEEAGQPQAMVGVEVAYGKQIEAAKAELRLFPAQLGSFTRIEEVDPAIEPYRQRSQQTVGQGHHTARSQQDAVHRDDPSA